MTCFVVWRFLALLLLRWSSWLGAAGAWCVRRAVGAGVRAGSTVRVVVDLDAGTSRVVMTRRRPAVATTREGIGC